MKKKLPIYDIILSDTALEQGVGFISLVDEPAIMVNWIKLAQQAQLDFKADKAKQLLYGPFLIPDMLIYRRDVKLGEYYVRFKKEQIESIANKFNKDRNSNNINFQHSELTVDAYVAENWIVSGEDKSKGLGFDLPEGTWFGGVKVEDQKFWNTEVSNDVVKGFSVEVAADLELELSNIKNKQTQMENEIKLASAKLVDGTLIYFDGTLAQDTLVFSDEAMTVPAVDGDYELENGDAIKVAGGKVAEYIVAEIAEGDMADAPVDAPAVAGITVDDVSKMIDERFASLMEEITAIKDSIAPLLDSAPAEAAMSRIVAIEEKLSSTPGAQSITKKVTQVTIDGDKFDKTVDRIKQFGRVK